MNRETELFIEAFIKELKEDNAAVFVGAGLSRSSGYVDWIGLLKSIAENLGLSSEKETDLVGLAQFHVNANHENRSELNQLLVDKFSDLVAPSRNHEIIASLPIKTIWTTNYDRLLEQALTNGGKRVDTKYVDTQMATTKPGRDAIIYKMHGDIEHPDKAILTKDDYEKYHLTHAPFVTALLGDLVERTFLFLGFSFTDPNLDYILSRIRSRMGSNQRLHYCLTKRRTRLVTESDGDYQYAQTRQALITQDLMRFNIKTIFADEYSDITLILQTIENRFRRKTVFVGGSAVEYGNWHAAQTHLFLTRFSKLLIEQDFRITSGFGLGVGGSIVSGAVQEIYSTNSRSIEQQLILRPFPIGITDPTIRKETFDRYRKELIGQAGIAVFFLGNKIVDGTVVLADGIRDEYDLAVARGLYPIPVGASEFISRNLWEDTLSRYDTLFAGLPSEARILFEELGQATDDPMKLLDPLLKLIKLLSKG